MAKGRKIIGTVFQAGKKLISRLCFTLLSAWAALAAMLIWPQHSRLIAAVILAVVTAGGIAGRLLRRRLSRKFPQLEVADLPAARYLIAVAGSGYEPAANRVPESCFTNSFVIRLTEAGRIAAGLAKRGISCRMCVSIPEHSELHHDKMLALQDFFARFNLPADRIEIIEGATDSFSELAAFNRPGWAPILVTHDWHLPRLAAIADALEIRAIPAPAGLTPDPLKAGSRRLLLPTAGSLLDLECALHELCGLGEITLRKRLAKPFRPVAGKSVRK